MEMSDVEKRFSELDERIRGLERQLDLLVMLMGGADLSAALQDEKSYTTDPEQLRAVVWNPPHPQQNVVEALQQLDTTLGGKLDAVKYLQPPHTALSADATIGTALGNLYAALKGPDWENPDTMASEQPTIAPQVNRRGTRDSSSSKS